jgi:hypothetical protein
MSDIRSAGKLGTDKGDLCQGGRRTTDPAATLVFGDPALREGDACPLSAGAAFVFAAGRLVRVPAEDLRRVLQPAAGMT